MWGSISEQKQKVVVMKKLKPTANISRTALLPERFVYLVGNWLGTLTSILWCPTIVTWKSDICSNWLFPLCAILSLVKEIVYNFFTCSFGRPQLEHYFQSGNLTFPVISFVRICTLVSMTVNNSNNDCYKISSLLIPFFTLSFPRYHDLNSLIKFPHLIIVT